MSLIWKTGLSDQADNPFYPCCRPEKNAAPTGNYPQPGRQLFFAGAFGRKEIGSTFLHVISDYAGELKAKGGRLMRIGVSGRVRCKHQENKLSCSWRIGSSPGVQSQEIEASRVNPRPVCNLIELLQDTISSSTVSCFFCDTRDKHINI